MELTERVETDSLVDMHVAVTEGEQQYIEAVGELHEDGLDGQSGDGMPPEAEVGRNGPLPKDAAGADMHHEQVAGNDPVANLPRPAVGSIPGFVEASATQTVGNPVPVVALPAQPLSVSGAYAHAPTAGMMPGVWSRLRIHRSFKCFLGCRIRVWDIRQHRLGE